MSNALVKEVVEHLEAMPPHLQIKVLTYVRTLDSTTPHGIPGNQLLQFAGLIPASDLEAMNEAIERGCEQVDTRKF